MPECDFLKMTLSQANFFAIRGHFSFITSNYFFNFIFIKIILLTKYFCTFILTFIEINLFKISENTHVIAIGHGALGRGGIAMTLEKSITTVKALADKSRIMLMNALLDRPQYVEELSERLSLSASTISFHLKKLEQAKLVRKEREQYYVTYHANRDALNMTLHDLLAIQDVKKTTQEERLHQYRDKVLRSFFRNGRLERLPTQRKKRDIILEEFAKLFEAGRTYPEQEVNKAIEAYYNDYCTLRRELIGAGLLDRKNGQYWLTDPSHAGTPQFPVNEQTQQQKEYSMDRRKMLIREYKENPPPAGIFRITNTANGKILIGKGPNVQGKLNSHLTQLKFKAHRNKALQEDWNQYGSEAFTFEVLDYLEEDAAHPGRQSEELSALEELWLDKLQPYGDKGYNRKPKKRKLLETPASS
jgi:predicted transcriptional regulator